MAVFVSMMPYCLVHFGKPLPETLGAIIAGIVLGIFSLKSRSILPGVLLHGGVALGIGALATALTGMKLKSLADEDTVTHNGFYGDRCQKGDYRLCSFDVSVINHQLDQADALGNASIGLLVGAVVLGGGGAALILTAPKAPKPRPADEHGSPPPPSASMGCGLTGGLGFTCAGQF